jgi:hypothetical protein
VQDGAQEWEGREGRVEVEVDGDVCARRSVEDELGDGLGICRKCISIDQELLNRELSG